MLAFQLLLIHSVFSSSLKPLQARIYPADVSSEASFDDKIWTFLDDDVQPFDKWRYTGSRRVTSYTWAPAPWEAATGFNISLGISGGSRGVKRDTIEGIYTFSNGTTKDPAIVGNILGDFQTIRQAPPDDYTGEQAIRDHSLTTARHNRDIGNKLLDSGRLICKTPTANGKSIHNELRRLL